MPKYTGRRNADEWTEEDILSMLHMMEELANNSRGYFIGSLLGPFKVSRKAYDYWRVKFCGNRTIKEEMDLIDSMLETHLVEDGMSGKIRTTMALYCLRCFHAEPAPEPLPVPQEPRASAARVKEPGAKTEAKTDRPPEQRPVTIEMPDGKVILFPIREGDKDQLPKEGFWSPQNWMDNGKPG